MAFYRYVISDQATFDAGEQIFPKICHFIRLRHVGGIEDAEISFQASGAAAQVILSPAGGTPYPQQVEMTSREGFDRVRVKALGAPPDADVEVTAWT